MRTHLIGFLASEKRQTLVEAVRRKALAVIGDVDLRIGLKARSLQMPLDELERRLWLLNQQVDEARRQRIIVADSLAGERRRAVERLYAQAEEVRKRVGASLRTAVEQFIATVDDPTEAAAQDVLAGAVPEVFNPELAAFARSSEEYVAGLLEPHRRQADAVIESVRRCAADVFSVPYRPLPAAADFQWSRRPYWVTYQWVSSFGPIPASAVDRILPMKLRRARVGKRMSYQLELLVAKNVGGLRLRLQDTLEEALRRFGREFDDRLADVISATQSAAKAALAQRTERSDTVAEEIGRLRNVAEQLIQLRSRLEGSKP